MSSGRWSAQRGFAAAGALLALAALVALLPEAEAAPQHVNGPDGWRYRVGVTTNSSINISDVQVPFTLQTYPLVSAGKMRSDCGDLRAYTPGGTVLPHWIESGCNTNFTRVWVRVPFVSSGSTTPFALYYGNPTASSTSAVSGTFVADSIRVEVSNCDPFSLGWSCPIVNHSTADDVRERSPNLCATSRTRIDYGYPCLSTSGRTDARNGFGVEYRFLFVPDVTGTWGFETRTDNWSEFATSATDEALVTGHGILISNFGDDHNERYRNTTLVAGQGRWYSLVASEKDGVEEQRLRLKRPGESHMTFSTANFPGMIYRRNYPSSMPFVGLQPEVSVPGLPEGSAVGYINQVNLTMTGVSADAGPGANCRIYARTAGDTAWTLRASALTDAMGQCLLFVTDGGLAHNTTREYMMLVNNSVGDGMPLLLSARTWGPPSAPKLVGIETGNRSMLVDWDPGTANGADITSQKVYVSQDGGPFALRETVPPTQSSYVASGLTNGAQYAWTVVASSALGDGPTSNVLAGVPSALPHPPVLTAAVAGNHSVALSWAPGDDEGSAIFGYNVYNGSTLVARLGGTSLTITGLANGYTYTYRVTALNSNGESALSNARSATPGAVPDPPGNLGAKAGDGQVALSWTPGATNGAALTGYQIWRGTTAGGATLLATTSNGGNTSFTVNGLTNGVTYFFNVTAVNSFGASASSNEVSAKPATTPGAPQAFAVAPGNRSATLTWTAPASTGGEPLLGYRIYVEATPVSGAIDLRASTTNGGNTSFVVHGLANGTSYAFAVAAYNALGDGTLAGPLVATPGARPDPPLWLSASRGDARVDLAWAPGSDNGASITGYRIWRGTTSGTTTTLATVGGTNTSFADLAVTNGVLYHYNVTAINSFGMSASSNEVAARPARPPDAPTLHAIAEMNGTLQLSWSPPADTGGEAISHYVLYESTSPEPTTPLFGTAATSLTLARTNGVTYHYVVTAVTSAGEGAPSNEQSGSPGTIPYPPTDLAVVAGNASAVVSWSPPVDDGGRPITHYVVECYNGCPSPGSWSTTDLSFTLTGLANGFEYAASVYAVNSFGGGFAPAPVSFVPRTVPEPPGALHAARGDGSAVLTWTPGDDGGSGLTGYRVWRDGVLFATTSNGANTSFVANGLLNGQTYAFHLTALNALGESAPSNVAGVTPARAPDAPVSLVADPEDHAMLLTWALPYDGGAPLTDFRIEMSNATLPLHVLAFTGSGANTSFRVAGLNNGETHQFIVRAINEVGMGAGSTALAAPRGVPFAPPGLSAARGNQTVALGWGAADGNGAAIAQYKVYRDGALRAMLSGSARSYTESGLTNGVAYVFEVTAVNAEGEGAAAAVTATPASIPDPPVLAGATRGDGQVSLAWTPGDAQGSPILHYQVFRRASTGSPSLVATVAGTSHVDAALTNGVTYHYTVRAVNDLGTSAPSNERSATPAGAPGMITSLGAGRGNHSASLGWVPPPDNGEPLLGYDIHLTLPDGTTQLFASTDDGGNVSFVANGLANGVVHEFIVLARNAVGTGPPGPSASVVPAGVPYPPQLQSATRGDGEVTLAWTLGDDNGEPLASTRLLQGTSPDALAEVATLPPGTTSHTRTGLTNGVTYHFALRHVNDVGAGERSNVLPATPAAAPAAPTGLTAARGNHSAALAWTPGADNGEPLAGYEIFVGSDDGTDVWALEPFATTDNGANTSFIAHGLENGLAHTFHVRARNAVGPGALSAPADVTPAGAPYPPALASATRGDGRVSLVWSLGSANGAALTSTRLLQGTAPDALVEVASLSAGATSHTRTGLTNGVTYYFALRHVNDVGTGNPSDVLSAKPATFPDAPTAPAATPANTSALLTWTPGGTGGEPLVGYDILVDGALVAQTADGANTSFRVHGLTNGVTYGFQVRARNAVGAGATSSPAFATPASIPDPPLLLSAVRGDARVTLSWSLGHDQGSPLSTTRVLMGTSPGSLSPVATIAPSSTTYTRAGLTNGITYHFALVHVNGYGDSNASNVMSARPATVPRAPDGLVGAIGDGQVALSWNAPSSSGGEPVTAYVIYSTAPGQPLAPLATIGSNRSFVVHGLDNGFSYRFAIAAVNAVGQGPLSANLTATPARAPDAPEALVAQAGSRQVSLHWGAPASDGGREVIGYRVYRDEVLLQQIGTNTSYTAAGLTDGVTYTFTVAAVNPVGEGAHSAAAQATPLSAPGAPASLSATTLEPSIRLDWTAPSSTGGTAILQYRIYASSSPGGARWLVATVGADRLSYVDAADPGTLRHYVVRALNVVGEGAASAEAAGATPADPLDPSLPDTYRSCTRDATSGAVACTEGSREDVVRVAAGGRHTCALLADGRVDCWGDDGAGQSGDHLAGRPAVAASAGATHTCVLLDDGNVDCYGQNSFNKAASYLGGDAVGVAAGGTHTCFLLAGGAATCQGSNAYGQIAGRASGVAAVAAGVSHTCFLLATGAVDCQGLDDAGQAADDATGDARQVVAGRYHTCVRTIADDVRCWGSLRQPVPASVQGATLALASGRDHVCALVVGGHVVCWGATRDGQSAGHAGGDAVAVAAGDAHGCALLADATLVCWGATGPSDHGQATDYPLAPAGSPTPTALSASPVHLPLTTDPPRTRTLRGEEA